MTYSQLQTKIAGFLHRSDLGDEIKDFIAYAEDDINATLRDLFMEQRAYTETVADQEYYEFPNSFLRLRNLKLDKSDCDPQLTRMSDEELNLRYNDTPGQPKAFAITGTSFRLRPIPDDVYTLEANFDHTLEPLSDTNTSNWFLEKHSNLYLIGSLMYGFQYVLDDGRADKFEAKFKKELMSLEKKTRSDKWSGSTLTTRSY